MKTGILWIHGIFGSPLEYQEIEVLFQQEGYETRSISLPGHGDLKHQCLGELRGEDLLSHSQAEYLAFSESCDQVFVVGHSLGGLTALILASAKLPKLKGIVALSAPFEHSYGVNHTLGLTQLPLETILKGFYYLPDQIWTGYSRPRVMLWDMPKVFPNMYDEAHWLFSHIKARIHQIDVPVCMAHSIYDLTVPYDEMEKIAAAIQNTSQITLHTLSESGHQIFPQSGDRERVLKLINEFIQAHL